MNAGERAGTERSRHGREAGIVAREPDGKHGVALGMLALGGLPATAAQEASPAASPEAMPGVTVEVLGLVEVAPGQSVPVVRVTLAPGAAIPPHSSPGGAVALVESGQVNYVVITGVVQRAGLAILPAVGTPAAGTPPRAEPR